MMEDEQTHTCPKSAHDMAHTACFTGFADANAFARGADRATRTVQGHYARLFERSAPLAGGRQSGFHWRGGRSGNAGNAARMGFRDPAQVSGAIRGWHHGRIRATRSAAPASCSPS